MLILRFNAIRGETGWETTAGWESLVWPMRHSAAKSGRISARSPILGLTALPNLMRGGRRAWPVGAAPGADAWVPPAGFAGGICHARLCSGWAGGRTLIGWDGGHSIATLRRTPVLMVRATEAGGPVPWGLGLGVCYNPSADVMMDTHSGLGRGKRPVGSNGNNENKWGRAFMVWAACFWILTVGKLKQNHWGVFKKHPNIKSKLPPRLEQLGAKEVKFADGLRKCRKCLSSRSGFCRSMVKMGWRCQE